MYFVDYICLMEGNTKPLTSVYIFCDYIYVMDGNFHVKVSLSANLDI
jgi:hypothetical protein